MTNAVKNLKKIVDPQSFEEAQGRADLILEEKDPSNPYKIDLKGVPAGSLLLKTENFILQPGFLARKRGLQRRADFALVDSDKIIFIELKSGKLNKTEIEQQFYGAKSAIEYCAAIGKHFFNDPNFLNPAIKSQSCVLLFKNKSSIKKRRTSSSQIRQQTSSSVFHRLDCDGEAYYRQLAK